MPALAAVLALLAAGSGEVEATRDVRWVVGPAAVVLGDRLRCEVPEGVALAQGAAAHAILDVVAQGADGSELAVLSPVAPSRTWYVVVAWRAAGRGEAAPSPEGAGREGALVWLERPRVDERTGRSTWALAGPGVGGPSVNRHVRLPAGDDAVEVTLVAPVEELSEARGRLDRIVDGLAVTRSDRR